MKSNLILTKWKDNHLNSLVSLANNPNIARTMGANFPFPYTEKDGIQWINVANSERFHSWAIEINTELVGGIVIKVTKNIAPYSGIIFYWIGEKFWGKGIATEATKRAVSIAFHELRFERLETSVLPWNTQSIKVLKKCNFFKDIIRKNIIIKGGEPIECDIYVLINPNPVYD
jgi:[ribosomal protein S5]-alanine N-acetyltransferase